MASILTEIRVFTKIATELLEIPIPNGNMNDGFPQGTPMAGPTNVTVTITQIIKKYFETFVNKIGNYTVLGTTHNLQTADLIAVVYDDNVPANMIIVPYTIDITTLNVTFNFLVLQSGYLVIM